MKMTGIVVMVLVAASAHAGIIRAEARQLTICMESASGNVVIENAARTVASGVFASINVKIEWRIAAKCPTEAIYVSFLSQTPVNLHRGALAYALPYEGTHIVVFLDRLKYTAPSAVAHLLGYTLVHEITHILEGEVRHSESGIMKAYWGTDDNLGIRQGHLSFAAEDVSLIYRGLDWRESRLAMASPSNAAAYAIATH